MTPEQFLGIEVKRWAKEIAELVLWIGYLQWQVRAARRRADRAAAGAARLRQYRVSRRRARLGRRNCCATSKGKPVTRWDGETMKISPVTGEKIPDEEARVPVYRYVNPRRAEWPAADFIIGNPPYIGTRLMRSVLGDGYVEALRATYDDVPRQQRLRTVLVGQSASLVRSRQSAGRLITTNSISQVFGRRVLDRHLQAEDPLSIVFAIPDHPWIDSRDGADVRVAMTCMEAGVQVGVLRSVVKEVPGSEGATVHLDETKGVIRSDLRVGADVGSAEALKSNESLVYQGVSYTGKDLYLRCLRQEPLLRIRPRRQFIKPYVNGRDIAARPRGVFAIDLFGFTSRMRFGTKCQHSISGYSSA